MAQNVMEIDFAEAGDQSFAILVIMALYLLIPRSQRGIYYLSLLAIVHLIIVNAKLHAAIIQLCGTTMKEFRPEMDRAQHSHQPVTQEKPSSHPGQIQMTKKAADQNTRKSNKIAPEETTPRSSHPADPEAVHQAPKTDMSRLQDRVVVHLLPSNNSPSPVQVEESGASIRLHTNSSCRQLYWFGSRAFMSFLFQLGLMELSLALVLLFYGLIIDQTTFIANDNLAAIVSCILVDVFVLCYASLKVQPLAALVSSVGTIHPAKLVAEIKKMKIVLEEDYEEGLGGKLVMTCFGAGDSDSDEEEEGVKKSKVGAKRKGKHGPHMAFVLMLADQAGIVGQGAHAGSTTHTVPAIHSALMDLWLRKAKEFTSVKKAACLESHNEDEIHSFDGSGSLHGLPIVKAEPMGELKCKLSAIHEAFEEIDQSGDGLISHLELADMLRELGTRVTREEVEDMVLEIDGMGKSDGAIDFTEFILFLSFKFLDYDNDGFVDRVDVARSLQTLRKSEEGVDGLLEYCLSVMSEEEIDRASLQEEVKSHRISLACFIRRFRDVELVDETTGMPPKSIEKKKAKRGALGKISEAVVGLSIKKD